MNRLVGGECLCRREGLGKHRPPQAFNGHAFGAVWINTPFTKALHKGDAIAKIIGRANVQVRGEPYWLAYRAPSDEEAVQWMHAGLMPRTPRPQLERRYISAVRPDTGTFAQFDEERLSGDSMLDLASAAMPGVPVEDAVWLHEFDSYYYDLRGARSLPVLRVRYADPERTWLYMDPGRGGIVLKTDDTRRLRRWLYQGLHSLDFPFLYYKRPLWDIVVIALSIGGLALSATTLVPAWRRLRRHARRLPGRLPFEGVLPAARPRPTGVVQPDKT